MTRGTYYRLNKQTTTDEVYSLDIRQIDKERFINIGWIDSYTCTNGRSIEYTIETDRLILTGTNQVIPLDKTRCHYGGFRYWFNCPRCSRRSAVLYNRNNLFLCRQCHKLPYTSQREGKIDRLIRKSRKIRKRVGASSNLSEPILFKPKGMHWKTFEYLRAKEMIISQKYVHAVTTYLGINLDYR